MTESQVFYRYESPDGRVLLVDDLNKLPEQVRSKAKRIQLEGVGKTSLESALRDFLPTQSSGSVTTSAATAQHDDATSLNLPSFDGATSVHLPSFAMGAAIGVGVSFVAWWLMRPRGGSLGKRILVSLIVTGALAAVLSGLYLGWLRRSTGQGDGVVATPTQLIDDAKRTMQLVEERRKQQEKQLEEIERIGK